jgi:hypothetical protein
MADMDKTLLFQGKTICESRLCVNNIGIQYVACCLKRREKGVNGVGPVTSMSYLSKFKT